MPCSRFSEEFFGFGVHVDAPAEAFVDFREGGGGEPEGGHVAGGVVGEGSGRCRRGPG
ncbi:hypothetical protein [Streptomyces sp. NPDC050428]|uniref:hypothetical protein n=1 Tax=Streptomyces sp. NPDC050428 TaxID=3155757 RepID=UPI0034121C95